MKKTIVFMLATLVFTGMTYGQKFGYVDSDMILKKMPSYQAAQSEIDDFSAKWQKKLEEMYKDIEEKYKEYQAEEVLLPDDIRKQRQEEIFKLERDAKEYKKSKFGFDGELYKLQDEKIKPIQDQVFEAIELIAKEKKLDFILDKSGESGIIYSNPLFDRSKDVMNKLGIKE